MPRWEQGYFRHTKKTRQTQTRQAVPAAELTSTFIILHLIQLPSLLTALVFSRRSGLKLDRFLERLPRARWAYPKAPSDILLTTGFRTIGMVRMVLSGGYRS